MTQDFSSCRGSFPLQSPDLHCVLCTKTSSGSLRVNSAHRAFQHPCVWEHTWIFLSSVNESIYVGSFAFFRVLLGVSQTVLFVLHALWLSKNRVSFVTFPAILLYSFLEIIPACLAVHECDWILHGAFWPRPDGWLARFARQSLCGARLV